MSPTRRDLLRTTPLAALAVASCLGGATAAAEATPMQPIRGILGVHGQACTFRLICGENARFEFQRSIPRSERYPDGLLTPQVIALPADIADRIAAELSSMPADWNENGDPLGWPNEAGQ